MAQNYKDPETPNRKRIYSPPHLELIVLDNETSILFMSDTNPPAGWGEEEDSIASEYFRNDPFKANLG